MGLGRADALSGESDVRPADPWAGFRDARSLARTEAGWGVAWIPDLDERHPLESVL
jgi:hypothetical protein